jgi:hypothetical protein
MSGKNPWLLAVSALSAVVAIAIFATFPFHFSETHILNSALNGAIGGAFLGLALSMYQQKKKAK